MGKNHRHKKQLKSEKSKVKLKGSKTKFLPKGQNVTNTAFKIKPIVLPNQLKEHTGEQVTSKKLNFKDIVNRLKHHNTKVKVENCLQMKEYVNLITTEELGNHLSDIIQAICPLLVDIEQKVRRESLKVLNDVLTLRSSNSIEPFFDRLTSHLCCSMTHISESIQEDSLLIIDTFLTHVPDLLAKRCDKIIKNFILLISRIKVNANDRSMLQTNVKNKKTSIQWRLSVLVRLKRMLSAISEKNRKECVNRNVEVKTVDVSDETVSVPIYYDWYTKFCVNPFEKNNSSMQWLETCVYDVLPLLKDIWMEVMPNTSHIATNLRANKSTTLTEESASTLNCILHILLSFHELQIINSEESDQTVPQNNTKLVSDIILLMLKTFPYVRDNNSTSAPAKKGGLPQISDKNCVEENLMISYLFLVKFERNFDNHNVKQVLNYLKECMYNRNYVSQDKSPLMLKVLTQAYMKNLKFWKNPVIDLPDFLTSTGHYFLYDRNQANNGIDVFLLLCDHASSLEEEFLPLAQKACLLLTEDKLQLKVLSTLLLLVKKSTKQVQVMLDILAPRILENINKIKIEGINVERQKIIHILNLFYYTPLSDQNISLLRTYGIMNPLYDGIVQQILAQTQK